MAATKSSKSSQSGLHRILSGTPAPEPVDDDPFAKTDYRFIRRLSRHGPARVLLAKDKRSHERVVLRRTPKESSHGLEDARIYHPAIADSHGRIHDRHGCSYMVSEFVPGNTLHELVANNGPLTWPDVEAIVRQLASALSALHEQGFVHGALRPSDCIIEPSETGELSLRLVDLGWRAPNPRHPAELRYMSPDQLVDWPRSPACDIFRVGLIAFELLTGRPAHGGDQCVTIKQTIICRPTPHPGMTIPAAVTHWLQCALAKNPFDRFESLSAMTEALDRISRAQAEQLSFAFMADDGDANDVPQAA